MGLRGSGRTVILACVLAAALPAAAAADGYRNIAAVTVTTYFDGSWRVDSSDVFLARVIPALTLEGRISRSDSPGWYQHMVSIGPIVSFTDTVYAELVYTIGVDSASLLTHELSADLNYETSTTSTSLGIKADWFPASGYSYYLPSISGKFHPAPALGLFGKFFLSVDSLGIVTESFWGEAELAFSERLSARAGFTVSRADAFGYSAIAGLDYHFTESLTLKYSLQYLSDTVDYIGAPEPRSGIVNTLVADIRF